MRSLVIIIMGYLMTIWLGDYMVAYHELYAATLRGFIFLLTSCLQNPYGLIIK